MDPLQQIPQKYKQSSEITMKNYMPTNWIKVREALTVQLEKLRKDVGVTE